MERITNLTITKSIPTISLSKKRCENKSFNGDVCNRNLTIEDGREFCWYCEEIAEQDRQMGIQSVRNNENDKFLKMSEHFERESLINPKLLKADFDKYIPENETQQKAKDYCKRYAENFNKDNPQSLLLIGKYGVGKSHLAVSATKIVMEQNIPTLFISVPRLLTKIKSTFKNSTVSELDILEMIEKVPLLVLDDIGAESDEEKEKVSSWAKTKIFEVVESRIGRHTIYTTNLSVEQLIATYGERNASRILEDSTRINIVGDNYRLKPKTRPKG